MKPRLASLFSFAFAWLLALGVPPCLLAQASGPMQQTKPGMINTNQYGERTYSVGGRVLDDSTGQAIEGARVMLTRSIGMSVQEIYVDFTGSFLFTEVPRGSYYVVASAHGYEEVREPVQVISAPVNGVFMHLRAKPREGIPLVLEPLDVSQELIPKEARKEYRRGVQKLRADKVAEALSHFDKAVELYPQYASAWHAKGAVHLLKLGQMAPARSALEKAVECNPKAAAPRVFLGAIYNADRRYAEARDHLLEALRYLPNDGLAHFEISRSYWGLQDVDNSEVHIIRAHDLAPRIPQVHMMRANVFIVRKNLESAVKELDEFLELAPKTAPESPVVQYVRQQRAALAARLETASAKP